MMERPKIKSRITAGSIDALAFDGTERIGFVRGRYELAGSGFWRNKHPFRCSLRLALDAGDPIQISVEGRREDFQGYPAGLGEALSRENLVVAHFTERGRYIDGMLFEGDLYRVRG